MRKRLQTFIRDKCGMEFIDVAVIITGSLIVILALYEIIKLVYNDINNTDMGIRKK